MRLWSAVMNNPTAHQLSISVGLNSPIADLWVLVWETICSVSFQLENGAPAFRVFVVLLLCTVEMHWGQIGTAVVKVKMKTQCNLMNALQTQVSKSTKVFIEM